MCAISFRVLWASGTRLCSWEHRKIVENTKCVYVWVRVCVYERVWVFGYHFSFHCAIMRSRGSSLDKNQNIASVDHMCSLLFRAKQKNTLSFVNSHSGKSNVWAFTVVTLFNGLYNNISLRMQLIEGIYCEFLLWIYTSTRKTHLTNGYCIKSVLFVWEKEEKKRTNQILPIKSLNFSERVISNSIIGWVVV